MIIRIIQFTHVVAYMVVTSQMLFYLLILSPSMRKVSLANFLELRKIIDQLMRSRFLIIYYATLAISLLATAYALMESDHKNFVTTGFALLCLTADMLLALKGNIPINNLINQYSPGDKTHDWALLRTKWLNLINIRGRFLVAGMITLLIQLI